AYGYRGYEKEYLSEGLLWLFHFRQGHYVFQQFFPTVIPTVIPPVIPFVIPLVIPFAGHVFCGPGSRGRTGH
ncbi:MAG: hypothetical protein AB1847_21435, partial [bacterium]